MESITVKIKCRAIRKIFGLLDHYFLEIGSREYHLGFYAKGKILPSGTTKGSHLVVQRQLCPACFQRLKIMLEFSEDVRLFHYYPFINCETLTTGCSVPLGITICAIPFLISSLYRMKFMQVFVTCLLLILCILIHSKFVFSRTLYTRCTHLESLVT